MANSSFRVKNSLNIEPNTAPNLSTDGDIGFNSTDSNLELYTGGSVKKVVTTAQTQTLTNKTLTSPVINTPTIDVQTLDGQASAPANPSAGNYKLYVDDTTSKLQLLDSSGTVTVVGSGAGGAQNFITNGDAESATTGWATYADAAGTSPVDGTAGSPTVTWTRTTSSPLTGLASFLFTKDAANRQGEGASYDFSIDRADQAKVCRIDFDYEVDSGTYADGDLTVWIYDVTNAQVIQPSASSILNAIGPQKKQSLSFQTNSNSTSYRLIVHVASTSASAYTVKFDSVSIVRQSVSQGTVSAELPVKTLTVGAVTTPPTKGTTTLDTVRTTRVGSDAVIEIDYLQSTTGAAAGSGIYLFTLPNSLVLDATKISHSITVTADQGDAAGYIGSGQIQRAGAHGSSVAAYMYDATRFYLKFTGGLQDVSGTGISADAGNAFGSATVVTFAHNLQISLKLRVPILGWSSSMQLSSDADTRVVSAKYNTVAGQSMANGASTLIDFGTKVRDTHGSVTTGGSWKFTIPVPGTYTVSALTVLSSGGGWAAAEEAYLDVYKNGAFVSRLDRYYSDSTHTARVTLGGTDDIDFVAGDYLDLRLYQGSGGAITLLASADSNYINIAKISGPAQIAASEVIAWAGRNAAGTGFVGVTTIPFATVDIDTHGGYSAGIYTVQAPGIYEITSTVMLDSQSWTAGSEFVYRIMIDGSTVRAAEWIAPRTATQYGSSVTVSAIIRLVAGQTINFGANQTESGANRNLIASTAYNMASIKRLGGVG